MYATNEKMTSANLSIQGEKLLGPTSVLPGSVLAPSTAGD